MKLSTRVRYAVRAVIDLGLNYNNDKRVLLKDIAKRQAVSVKYLENIFATLRKADIVKGVRGAKGGYALARPAAEITMYDIVLAMQGFISPIGCVEDACSCNMMEECVARNVWREVSDAVSEVLKGFTIKDLIEKHHNSIECNIKKELSNIPPVDPENSPNE